MDYHITKCFVYNAGLVSKQRLQCDHAQSHRDADRRLEEDLAAGGVAAQTCDQLQHHDAAGRGPDRDADAGFAIRTEDGRDQQRKQRDRRAPDDRPLVEEGLAELASREPTAAAQASPRGRRVGVGEPVERGASAPDANVSR